MILHGLIAAPFTPFKGERIAPDTVCAYADYLKKSGVSGVFVNGTTGEGYSLSNDERMKMAEAWQSTRTDKFKIVIHVGHLSLPDAQTLARHAQELQVDAISTIAPCFYRPGLEELVDYCAAVAGAAPETPFYFYHMPSMSGVEHSMRSFIPLAEMKLPSFAGIKYTHEDLMDFRLSLASNVEVLFGRDEILLAALSLGAVSAVGSTYNYAAPLYLKMIEAFKAGRIAEAQALQLRSQRLIEVLIKYGGGITAGKIFMRKAGIDCGACRLPLKLPSSDSRAQLEQELDKLQFGHWDRSI